MEDFIDALMQPANLQALSSYIPIMIAALALGLSCYQVYSTTRNNKLMVTPRIDHSATVKGFIYSFKVVNTGIGPAIIDEVRYVVDGKFLPTGTTLEQVVTTMFDGVIAEHHMQFNYLEVNGFLPAGKEIELVRIDTQQGYIHSLDVREQTAQRIQIKGRYRSIYGRSFTFNSNESLPVKL